MRRKIKDGVLARRAANVRSWAAAGLSWTAEKGALLPS